MNALQAFCQGDVSDEELERVADHLQACSTCEALLTKLEPAADPLITALRRSARQSTPGTDPLLQQLQDRLEGALPAPVTPLSFQLPCKLGKYELLELLGGGGMGVVYRARQTSLQRIVAVKVLSPRLGEAPTVVRRFQEEIRLIGTLGLRQPHLVVGIDAEVADGRTFLVMEHIDGIDLARLVRSVGPLPVAAVGEIGYQAAQGLQSLHELDLVHRDVKPSNIMLADGVVRLLDFGLARVAGERDEVSDITASDQFLGTVDYVSPEQIEDPRRVDARADIYSLGCTLFFLLTGQAPFTRRQSRQDKCRAHQMEAPPDIRQLRPDVPPELASVVMRMLAKNPSSRFLHAADVVHSLDSFANRGQLRDVASLVPKVPIRKTGTESTEDLRQPTVRPVRLPDRSRMTPAAVVGVVAIVVAIIAATTLAWSALSPTTEEPDSQIPHVEIGRSVVPRSLLNTDSTANSFFQVNEGTNKLHLVSSGLQLVKLGTLDRDDVLIEIAMEVSELKSDSGHAGMFVAYRDTADREKTEFQAIRLETSDTGKYFNRRIKSFFFPQTPKSRGSHIYSSIELTNVLRVNTIRLKIEQGKLKELSWNGKPVETLAAKQDDNSSGGDLQGLFGVYTDNAVAVFSSYRIDGVSYEFKQSPN